MKWVVAMIGVAVGMAVMAADGGRGGEGTVCYVYNQRTRAGQWVACEVHELLADGGINPDGGHRR